MTLIPGDGVCPELCKYVQEVVAATGAPIRWDEVSVSGTDPSLMHVPEEVLSSIRRNKVCLKGGLFTPIKGGHTSFTIELRKQLDLYANVVPVKTIPGFSKHPDTDIVVIRENTEGEYSGLEHQVAKGVVEALKVTTKEGSERIAHFAFQWAREHGRKRVTVVHKANIMKLTDGLFLKTCTDISSQYPDIKMDGVIVDNACMQIVSKPEQYDVLLTPNLYGALLSNIAAALTGGTGYAGGASIGHEYAVFEQGSSSGNVGIDLVGKNMANPCALMNAASMMLTHIGMSRESRILEDSLLGALRSGKSSDNDGTSAFVKTVLENMKEEAKRI